MRPLSSGRNGTRAAIALNVFLGLVIVALEALLAHSSAHSLKPFVASSECFNHADGMHGLVNAGRP